MWERTVTRPRRPGWRRSVHKSSGSATTAARPAGQWAISRTTSSASIEAALEGEPWHDPNRRCSLLPTISTMRQADEISLERVGRQASQTRLMDLRENRRCGLVSFAHGGGVWHRMYAGFQWRLVE